MVLFRPLSLKLNHWTCFDLLADSLFCLTYNLAQITSTQNDLKNGKPSSAFCFICLFPPRYVCVCVTSWLTPYNFVLCGPRCCDFYNLQYNFSARLHCSNQSHEWKSIATCLRGRYGYRHQRKQTISSQNPASQLLILSRRAIHFQCQFYFHIYWYKRHTPKRKNPTAATNAIQ